MTNEQQLTPKSLPNTKQQLEQALRTAETLSSLIKRKLELTQIPQLEVSKLIKGLIN